MKAKIFTFFLFLAVCGVAMAQTDVWKTPMAATVDAAFDASDPWQEDLWVDQTAEKESNTTTDMTSKFQLLHDDDNIYIAAEVMDATPNNSGDIGNTYERDCIELFFHMSYTDVVEGDYGAYQPHTWQIRYQRDGDEGPFVDGSGNIQTLIDDSDHVWEVATDETGWKLEAQLPIATLVAGYADWDGESFKFDIQTGDNTTGAAGGRTQQVFWNNNSDDQWRDSQTFGQMVLSQTEIVIGAVQAVRGDMAQIFVQNDFLRLRNIEGDVAIFSVSGALVKQAVVRSDDATIDIAELKSGIYFVKTEELTTKVIK